MDDKQTKTQQKTTAAYKVMTVLGAILCAILIPILVINCTLIVKSFLNKNEVPAVKGTLPLIVLTDSMYPVIHSGDLIICHTRDAEEIVVGDVIAFFDPAGNGTSIVTHRVTEVFTEEGEIFFRTKGDANNMEDDLPVPGEKLVGVYQSRIAGLGNVVMFMQTTPGWILCVLCPILLLVGYDVLRRKRYENARKQDTEALLKELEELRAQKAGEN